MTGRKGEGKYADYHLNPKPVLIGLAAGVVMLALALVVVYLSFAPFNKDISNEDEPAAARPSVAAQKMSVQQTQQQQRDRLQRYGWTDRQHAIAHIPIDKAMTLVQQRYDPTAADRRGGDQ